MVPIDVVVEKCDGIDSLSGLTIK
ncbi:unnamed protein product, partial [Rotaria magnacalcarata]